MIGDNWEWDVAPSVSIGIPTYWIAEPDKTPPESDVPLVRQGTLADLLERAKSGMLAL